MLFPLRVIRRIHREGFRCIPEAIRFRIALHRQRPCCKLCRIFPADLGHMLLFFLI